MEARRIAAIISEARASHRVGGGGVGLCAVTDKQGPHTLHLERLAVRRNIWLQWIVTAFFLQRLLSSLMLALAQGFSHEEERVQSQLTEFFLVFCVTAYAVPLVRDSFALH